MLVFERMTHNPITIRPDTPVAEALQLMRENNIRRLPVLDKKERLIGMVTEKELLYASPSPVTSAPPRTPWWTSALKSPPITILIPPKKN